MLPTACIEIREALAKVPYLAHIETQDDYEQALALMDVLIDDYDANKFLIEILSLSIDRWEVQADEFAKFNSAIAGMDCGIAVLKTLMGQYRIGVADLPELGSKNNVSKLLNSVEGKKLNRQHIEALSQRFGVPVSFFFSFVN
ncbi:transcriptional regulator [Shewanella sp. SW36]|uniref:helix-turn-helix domain-containing protein n=1 Tax=unclassified Shewanella TaxID=196818 RepID=UPI0021D91953|nr:MULTISPECIES: transcriptional regulator [unclassified Shewanella]MCU7978057.1 transcriptional regulator [Shewanella sp. SW36]MCU7993300.1 transcriptional regulator [Shewanella sp. SW1]MCU8054582.1 transcriptional regulator [Shewanella sp. SM43]